MNPAVIGAVADVITALVAIGTACFVLLQVREIRRASHASAFKAVYDILQTDSMREEREFVIVELAKKTFADWTSGDKKRAERVCQSYDSVGIMCKHQFSSVAAIADSWGDSLRKCWKILSPLVAQYRVERNSAEFWDDFEWLAKEAEKFKKRIYD